MMKTKNKTQLFSINKFDFFFIIIEPDNYGQ